MFDQKDSGTEPRVKRNRSVSNRGETIDQSIIHLLHRSSQRASEIFAFETREFDLTARQYAVMTTIARQEGLSQTDLVRLTGIDRSTLADVVQRLLRRGIIERKKTTRDGRTYAVTLSEEGRNLLQTIKPYAKRADRTVLSLLGEKDGAALADTLSRLIRKQERVIEDEHDGEGD
jgi:DNA-binding MarR family transcriptional regulator